MGVAMGMRLSHLPRSRPTNNHPRSLDRAAVVSDNAAMRLRNVIMAVTACLLVAQGAIADACCTARDAAPPDQVPDRVVDQAADQAADQAGDAASHTDLPAPQGSLFRFICTESPSKVPCCTVAEICRVCPCGDLPMHTFTRSVDPGPQRHGCASPPARLDSMNVPPTFAVGEVENIALLFSSRAHARLVRLQL